MKWKIGRYTFYGFLLDTLDWIGIGMIPILLDVVDVVSAIFWMMILKSPVGLAALIEVIPFADVLPMNIALGLVADSKRGT